MPNTPREQPHNLPYLAQTIYETTIEILLEHFDDINEEDKAIVTYIVAAIQMQDKDEKFLNLLDRAYALTKNLDMMYSVSVINDFYSNARSRTGQLTWDFFTKKGDAFSKADVKLLRKKLLQLSAKIFKQLGNVDNITLTKAYNRLNSVTPDPSWRVSYLHDSRLTPEQQIKKNLQKMHAEQEEAQANAAAARENAIRELKDVQIYLYKLIFCATFIMGLIATGISVNEEAIQKNYLIPWYTLFLSAPTLVFSSLFALLENPANLSQEQEAHYLKNNRRACLVPSIFCALTAGSIYATCVDSNSLSANSLATLVGGFFGASLACAKRTLLETPNAHFFTP